MIDGKRFYVHSGIDQGNSVKKKKTNMPIMNKALCFGFLHKCF